MSKNLTSTLSVAEWAEIKRITGEIMAGIATADPQRTEDHIRGVLARNIMAANAAYDAQLRAEETHQPPSRAIAPHDISTCSPAYCGRARGQRRG